MDIEDLKNQFSGITVPESIDSIHINESDDSFIANLKKEDSRSKSVLKRFYIAYFIISVVYFGIFVVNPDSELKWNDRINGILLFLCILFFTILAGRKYSKLNRLRYDRPAIDFIKQTIERFKFWNKEMYSVLLIVLLIDVASTRSFISNYPYFSDNVANIVLFQCLFISVMLLSMYLGYKQWKKHKKPILDESLEILRHSNS